MNPAEVNAEKTRLINWLDSVRRDTLAALENLRPDQVIHMDSGWRLKDIIAHLAAWEQEALKSIVARQNGATYSILDFVDFDTCNRQIYRERRDLPYDQLYAEWAAARERLKAAIRAMPPERFADEFPYPWPVHGTLSNIIKDMAEHEQEHLADLRRAAQTDG